MFTLKNESGDLLKYVFKDRFVFNGEANARSIIVYKCKKKNSALKLLKNCIASGIKNVEIVEVSDEMVKNIPKPKAPTKVDKMTQLESDFTEEQLNKFYEEEDEMVLFKELNKKCLGCTMNCKQSKFAIIYRCPQFSPAV